MINEIKGSLPLSLPGIVGTENLRGLPALYPRDCTPRMEDGGLYPRFILDRQLFPRNAVNSCARTQGWTTDRSASPVRRRVNYHPSNRIDVKDLRRVVLPPYSVSAVSRFLSSSPARERKRERERGWSDLSFPTFETHDRCARDPNEKLFEKSSRCIYPSDIGRRYGRPSFLPSYSYTLYSYTPVLFVVLSPPDLNQIAGMIYGDVKRTRPIPSSSSSSIQILIILHPERHRQRLSQREIYILRLPFSRKEASSRRKKNEGGRKEGRKREESKLESEAILFLGSHCSSG